MVNTVKAELRKFFSTRLWWGMAIGAALVSLAFSTLFALIAGVEPQPGVKTPGLDDPATLRGAYTAGLQVAYLLTLSIGVMVIGSEYRHRTITSTFLATPKRGRVMGAKVIALMIIGAFYGVISMICGVIPAAIVAISKGYSAFPDASIWRTLAMGLLVLGLWGLIGLGAGILIPNQVAALLVAVGVAWIVEPIAGAVLRIWDWGQTIAMYFPSAATSAMMAVNAQGMDGTVAKSLSWWAGALVLTGYAALMAGIGTLLTLRRDVT